MYEIYYTADLRKPETFTSGWWSPDTAYWEIQHKREDVTPDFYDDNNGERSPYILGR
jgi:hypothetical protein